MEKLLVFITKVQGKDEGEKLARWFQDYVKEKQPELYVELAETGPSIDDAELVKKAEAIEADTLVIIGGDGTIHHIVQAFQKHYLNTMSDYFQVELSTTLHVFLRFPSKEEAADVILEGNVRKIDYGQVNDEVIISTLTIGILADTAVWISQEEKQRYGSWIFIKKFCYC